MSAPNARAETRHPPRYRADIGGGTLMLPESRKVASLPLKGLPAGAWQKAIEGENVLQKTSPAGAKRVASLRRAICWRRFRKP